MQKSNAEIRARKNVKSKARDVIPDQFKSMEAAAEFWDTHDLTDYLEEFREVKNVAVAPAPQSLRLEEELAGKIAKVARQRGISCETLVNRWLQQKLAENSKRAKRRGKASARANVASR